MITFRISSRSILTVLLPLFLGGCAGLAPDSRMDEVAVEVPGAWNSSDEARAGVDNDWIAQFGDRRLIALVKEAEKANPDLKAAAARVRVAQSIAKASGADRRPQAQLGFDASRSKRNFIGFPAFGGGGADSAPGDQAAMSEEQVLATRSNSFGLSLDVRWELDVWGRIRAGESAAIADAQAAAADYQAARVSLAAQVAKAYFSVVESSEQVRAAEEARTILAETEEVVRQRFETGQGDAGNVGGQLRLARSDVSAAEAEIAEAKQRREMAARQLETLLGRYPKVRYDAGETLPTLGSTPPAGLPSGMLMRRPDVLAAERRFAASGKSVSEAKRAVFPQIKLTGSGGTSTEDLNQILNSDFGVWNLAAGIVQPILTGGQIRATYEQRLSAEDEALANLQKTVLNAFLEVENGLANERWLAEQERAFRSALKLAEEADAEARATFRDGVGGIFGVFETQRRVISARRQLVAVRLARLENRIDLHLSLGGDFRP